MNSTTGSRFGERAVFVGVGAALVTLFGPDGELDAKATASHACRLVDAGVTAVVVAGSTGEATALSDEERVELLTEVRAALPAETPVIAGTGAPSAHQAVRLTGQAVAVGAAAVLALAPVGSRDLPGYYSAVAGAADGRPVLAYHYPGVSAPGVPVDALADLPVAGLKDSSDDPSRLLAEVTGYSGWIYVGTASMLPWAHLLGVTGAILALANAAPEKCVAAFGGDVGAQRDLAQMHLRARAGGPRRLKEMVREAYGTPASARLG